MSTSRVPLELERHQARRARRWPFFAAGLVLGFVAGAIFMLYGIHRVTPGLFGM